MTAVLAALAKLGAAVVVAAVVACGACAFAGSIEAFDVEDLL